MNAAEHGGAGLEQPDVPAATSTDAPSTLREEHALLMREVTTRAEMVLREADKGRWPQPELQELLNYLHLEVLRQVADTEWLLFRAAHRSPDELARLRRDHLELRLAIDVLTQAAATGGGADGPSPPQLAAATRDLLAQLDGHLAAEQQLLATAGGAAPSTASLGSQPHEWYSLIEGPVIDLDTLPGDQGVDAALSRLIRLEPEVQVELRCSSDPSPLWQRLARADPGGYGLAYLERGPHRWRLEITRRTAHWTPHPHA
jgi:uncharacterized protein (DUF2249 family)